MAKSLSVSPLAPEKFPDLPVVPGVRFSVAEAGVRYAGRTDVMLAVCDPGTVMAGVFTRSSTRAAPVLDCQNKISGNGSEGAAIIVNSGNANAFTGKSGMDSTRAVTEAVADATGLPETRVFSSSTGVIGEPLPHQRIVAVTKDLNDRLNAGDIEAAARAIMTTDTFPKGSARIVETDTGAVTIAGIAKGSGMIAPDMATMLVYLFTDAVIDRDGLQKLVTGINERTFNCITVDSDTSTSDTLLCAATGASGVSVEGSQAFAEALESVMLDLAHQVVRDGEGATKFVQIDVNGARDHSDARKVAMSIANSPLIKTAIAGEDPNWGRVVMAVGKSGAEADRDLLSICFGDIKVAENGWVSQDYREESGAAYMKQPNLRIGVDMGLADGQATVWTCDLTHGYISINADYRS